MRERVVEIAHELIDSPCIKYVPGHPELGQSPETGFDCSGFVSYVLRESGLTIPDYLTLDGERRPIRHTNEYFDHFGFAVHQPKARAGDLVFFSLEGWTPSHIGIYVGDDEYIHAPGKDGEVVTKEALVHETIAPKARDGHPIVYVENPIGFKTLSTAHDKPSYRVYQRGV